MKKFVSILLVLIIMISIIPSAAFAAGLNINIDFSSMMSGFTMPPFLQEVLSLFQNFNFLDFLRVLIDALGFISFG